MSGVPFPSPTLLGFTGERRAPGDSVSLKQFPSSLSPLLSPHATALDYVLDGDTDRRLRGQVPRVTFLSRGPDDPKHQASGTVWLKHQHDRVCGDTTFQLQVDTDPLASQGHCHCMISSLIPLSFFPNIHSHLVLRSRLLGSLHYWLLPPYAFCQVPRSLEMETAGPPVTSGSQSPKSWVSSLLHFSCSPFSLLSSPLLSFISLNFFPGFRVCLKFGWGLRIVLVSLPSFSFPGEC